MQDWLPLDTISEALVEPGYVIVPDIIPEAVLESFDDIAAKQDRVWKWAAIGRGPDTHRDFSIRSDRILWLDARDSSLAPWFAAVESLREALNRRLFLGLWDFECHLAYYPEGSFYRRHVDAFQGRSNRRVSVVLYMNRDWQEGDGGELVLYPEGREPVVVPPRRGTLVLFLSEELPHEVLPAKAERYSLAGWFRINDSTAERVDPAR